MSVTFKKNNLSICHFFNNFSYVLVDPGSILPWAFFAFAFQFACLIIKVKKCKKGIEQSASSKSTKLESKALEKWWMTMAEWKPIKHSDQTQYWQIGVRQLYLQWDQCSMARLYH